MKKIMKIEGFSSNRLACALNKDIERLNFLIEEYNAASASEQPQILLEIYEYYQFMLNKFPQDQACIFGEILYCTIHVVIEKEFKNWKVKPYIRENILNFEFIKTERDTRIEALNILDRLIGGDVEAFEFFFKKAFIFREVLKTTLAKIHKEKDELQWYKDLNSFKDSMKLLIAVQSADKRKPLRLLVRLINEKLRSFHVTRPKLFVNETNSFSVFLAQMDPYKVSVLAQILSAGPDFDKLALSQLYHPKEKGAAAFIQLLKTHTITFLGGTNSRNFKIGELSTGRDFVLKVENRLDAPRSLEVSLETNALSNRMVKCHIRRDTFYLEKGTRVGRTLIITDFCKGGDLHSFLKQSMSDEERLNSALSFYQQIAQVLVIMRKSHVAFPDMKNSNWLVNSNGIIKIADAKSFRPITKGLIGKRRGCLDWYDELVFTKYISPPEIITHSKEYNADAIHAFILGKNLYQYLSRCTPAYLADKHDAVFFDFSLPIFQSEEGMEFKLIIQNLVKPKPEDRASINTTLKALNLMQSEKPKRLEKQKRIAQLKQESMAILNNLMERYDFEDEITTVEEMAAEIRQYNNIYILEDILGQLKVFKLQKDCEELIQKICSYRINPQDQKMFDFRDRYLQDIEETNDIEMLNERYNELQRILTIVSSNEVKEIKRLISRYRYEARTELFSYGKKAKADGIEAALLNVPIELRDKIFSNDPKYSKDKNLLALRDALAKHRYITHLGAASYKDSERTVINLEKSPVRYKNLQKKCMFFKEEMPKDQEQGKPIYNFM